MERVGDAHLNRVLRGGRGERGGTTFFAVGDKNKGEHMRTEGG